MVFLLFSVQVWSKIFPLNLYIGHALFFPIGFIYPWNETELYIQKLKHLDCTIMNQIRGKRKTFTLIKIPLTL